MHFGETLVPAHGIYAVKVQIEGEEIWRKGAANIGIRPMFETAMPMLETYIFDFELGDQTLAPNAFIVLSNSPYFLRQLLPKTCSDHGQSALLAQTPLQRRARLRQRC